MQDFLTITGLPLSVTIGVYAEERISPQPLRVDITFRYDASIAASTDSISDALNYETVLICLRDLSQRIQPTLIETFADNAIRTLFANFSCEQVQLCVHKPQAIPPAKDVSITLTRARNDYHE